MQILTKAKGDVRTKFDIKFRILFQSNKQRIYPTCEK